MIRDIRREEINRYAERVGFTVGEEELDGFHALARDVLSRVERFQQLVGPLVPRPSVVAGPRNAGRPPLPGEDPCNAVLRWVDVRADEAERTSDLLAGKRVALKDLIAVAGVPMTVGSRVMQNSTPQSDAVLTERVLRAGGRIVAMTNLEALAFSGGGETSSFGPIRNPFDLGRTASGSSGGSASVLFHPHVDIAFGTDQGGSIRLPASWCGVLGLKPTFSLVPYTGLASLDRTFDHVGPLTRTASDMAIAMAAVSGAHPSDPRQAAPVPELPFVEAVRTAGDDLRGLRIGILTEGTRFPDDGHEGRTETLAAVERVWERFAELGAELVEISVPEHEVAGSIMFAALLEGVAATVYGNGEGYHFSGRYAPEQREAFGKGVAAYGDEMPGSFKAVAAIGEYLRDRYFGAIYATAQSSIPALRTAYDQALAQVDVIAMPTASHYAHRVDPTADDFAKALRGWTMLDNTPLHNATGHPALSIPAAEADGLPVGAMLVGAHFSDHRLIAIAETYERRFGWLPQPAPVHGSEITL
ncbi:amidase family protein [Nonomuraea sp. CA-218870]